MEMVGKMSLTVVILAAGKGSRMSSKKPKVLQKLAGKNLIEHVLDTIEKLNVDQTIIVHGHLGNLVQDALKYKTELVMIEQKERLGTGHAVSQVLPYINKGNKVLILYGDVPLISSETLQHFVDATLATALGILTATVKVPFGLGRIIRNRYNEVEKIVEEKDATEIEKQICEINTGIYCVSEEHLSEWLPLLQNNNAQGEYYLTDIVAIAKDKRIDVSVAQPLQHHEICGVNTRNELAALERVWHNYKVNKIMDSGTSLADPARVDVRGNLEIGQDSWIDINVLFEGNVNIGENCNIGANVIIINSDIGDNVTIKANSIIEDSKVDAGAELGPFARIRPGSTIAEDAKIGNFVEVKSTLVGKRSKINHLSYVGDSIIGVDCNIGAGVITVNYDGAKKHKTVLHDNVFIGCNSQLIAPLEVGESVTVGAGSTITKDVPEETLAISRSSQRHISGWSRPSKVKN
jgi:bifunctional UDP-N-acetylglucosamine pyrophosphorylase / glucosamine-1-phosphate N-acetyltransferase